MLLGGYQGYPATADLEGMAPIVLTVEARLKRTGIEKRMVLGNGLEAATADPSLHANYYNGTRTHLSLGKDTPLLRAIQRDGWIQSVPHLGGLHRCLIRI